jgi:retron-type reverse transcriptase
MREGGLVSFFDWLRNLLSAKPPPAPSPEPAPAPAVPAATSMPAPPPAPGATWSQLDLNAADFLPLGGQELQDAARNLPGFGPWFGRREVIPPADDPRTQVIDRAMVANGLLTPEELVEMHQVGAEMERVRPSVVAREHQAARAGEAAVQAEREERARRKQAKKAEAQARKQRRAEEVARRRKTDILFLGRGVSGRLGDRVSNDEQLASWGLPVLRTPADLAAALGLEVPRLRWLAFHNEAARRVHYVSFTVPKKTGGTRTLSAPHRTLAAAQSWVLDNILGRFPVEPPAHGFVMGRSTLSNALPHRGQAVVVNLDLADFFPSITFPRVRSVFQRAGFSPAVATILALLCTECPRIPVQHDGITYHVAIGPRALPQGACTSPALSNQVARRLDRRLGGLARKLNLTYTRYADDLTFSGGAEANARVGYLLARVRHLAQEEGFAVNVGKTRVQRRNRAQSVTGLVVNDRVGVPRRDVRRLRAILHRARTQGLEAQNRAGRPHFATWLQGMIAYVSMVRPETGARLRAELRAVLGR